MTSIEIEEAENRVRLCVLTEITQRHMSDLAENGLKLPDHDTALIWEREIEQANALEFVSTEIKRPFLDFLFSEHSPTHLVRVVFRSGGREGAPRHFRLVHGGIDRETSKFWWSIVP